MVIDRKTQNEANSFQNRNHPFKDYNDNNYDSDEDGQQWPKDNKIIQERSNNIVPTTEATFETMKMVGLIIWSIVVSLTNEEAIVVVGVDFNPQQRQQNRMKSALLQRYLCMIESKQQLLLGIDF